MNLESIEKLAKLCSSVQERLKAISIEEFSRKPSPDKWSKKEILGHLIDSACHQHQKLIRGQFEKQPCISYDQDQWTRLSGHQQADVGHLIDFWGAYNRHLVFLSRLVLEENLQRTCRDAGGNERTLLYLMEDYLQHLEHHLAQIIQAK